MLNNELPFVNILSGMCTLTTADLDEVKNTHEILHPIVLSYSIIMLHSKLN